MKFLRSIIPRPLINLFQQYIHPALQARYDNFLEKRIPPARRITLHQKNIFIFLSSAGFGFSALLLLLLLLAINYQNSLVYIFTFLLAAFMSSLTWVTFRNLSQLTIQFKNAEPCFAGEKAGFTLQLMSPKNHFSVFLQWPDEEKTSCHIKKGVQHEVELFSQTVLRGYYYPGRLKIFSEFPSGLFRTWSWVNPECEVLVYPKPVFGVPMQGSGDEQGEEVHKMQLATTDELAGFRNYQPGDTMKQIYWKSLAKGKQLQTKQFEEISSAEHWLDYESAPGFGVEEKLSILCGWAIEAREHNKRFGLKLPHQTINPAEGDEQLSQVLAALALFNDGQAVLASGGA